MKLNENVTAKGSEILAVIDVQDQNDKTKAFGTHEVTLAGDDRFVITKSGGAAARRDSDRDGSTWELRPVKGAKFDYETQADAFEQNLLEDFMLVIDDHLDIA